MGNYKCVSKISPALIDCQHWIYSLEVSLEVSEPTLIIYNNQIKDFCPDIMSYQSIVANNRIYIKTHIIISFFTKTTATTAQSMMFCSVLVQRYEHTRQVRKTIKHTGIFYSLIRNVAIYHRSLFYITLNPAAAFTPASEMLD